MIEAEDDLTIAIVGISGRFPGAKNISEFWQNLIDEKESISFFTEEELLNSGIDSTEIKNSSYVPARGILEDTTFFDAPFFKYSPRDAEILDPQHRIFLECAWHALEDAGIDPSRIQSRIGVFAGTGTPWYHLALNNNPNLSSLANGMRVIIGNEKDYLTNRVSFKLNLTGPSIAVQCACSTSLTAVVLGMQSLLNHQSDVVLAGGVSIQFPEKQGYLYEKGGLDSPDGHCRTFDKQAQGTVFSSGAGIVVLKRLQDALKDNDHVYCSIRSGCINNDGSSKADFTAPSIEGQAALEIEVLEMAGVHPETISYVEAHGTATPLGDPIEIKALTHAFSQYTSRKNYCAIGSVKTNIGHTDVASGVIGLIKVALAMKYKTLPAILHFQKPNPQINFADTPFYVNTETVPWQAQDNTPRRALVNSFGVGGTNACLLVEEVFPKKKKHQKKKNLLLPLSAKSDTALEQIIRNLYNYVLSNPNVDVADLSYSLQTGRAVFDHRYFIPFSSREQLISKLSDSIDHGYNITINHQKNRKIIFMFPGQGNQYVRMGQGLYTNESFFKNRIDKYCDYLINTLGYKFDLREMVFNPSSEIYSEEIVDQTEVAQPAIFIIELVLAEFLISLGLLPQALIGHSVGEFVSAVIAETMSVEDGLKIVATRGELTQKLKTGSMLAIFADKISVYEKIKFPVEISVMNAPHLTIVSGPEKEIIDLEKSLQNQKIACKSLNTSHAFHSHMMDPLIPSLEKHIADIELSPPNIPIMSTVTGEWLEAEEAINPTYWAEHARKPVNFLNAIQNLSSDNNPIFIEVGPGISLKSALKYSAHEHQVDAISLMNSKADSTPADIFLNHALGKLWALGASINFEQLYQGEDRSRLSLPGYPFQKEEYVITPDKVQKSNLSETMEERKLLSDWFYLPSWKRIPLIKEMVEEAKDSVIDTWIIFHHMDNFSQKLVEYLEGHNQQVFSIQKNSKYQQNSPTIFSINPRNVDEYTELFKRLSKSLRGKLRILHLWNFQEDSIDSFQDMEEAENFSFYEPLCLEQALVKSNLVHDISISFVANRVYSITNESIEPIKSLLTGPVKVFGNEYSEVDISLIDLPIPVSKDEQLLAIHCLISENKYPSSENIVAYRNGTRWIPTFEPKRLEEKEAKMRPFKEQGLYLITGGLGAIGLTLAQYIAANVNATILFLQRTSFPEKNQWDSWIKDHPKNDPTSIKISKLRKIEALGSEVKILQGDISSYDEVKHIIDKISAEHGSISGIIHCAGVPSGGIIPLKTRENAKEVLKSKVCGTLFLDNALKKHPLDFFILCSSITSILGEEGQVDYCSANAFLDAFSQNKNLSCHGIFTSINWDTWNEIGMAVEARNTFTQSSKNTITSILERKNRLKSITKTENEETFTIDLNLEEDWFIHSHLLHKIPTLVGTAFLEFLNEYVHIQSANNICVVSNAQYIAPFMVFSGETKDLLLHIVRGTTSYKFTFFSQHKNSNTKYEHFTGEIQLKTKQFQNQINLQTIIERLKVEPITRKVFDNHPDNPLSLGSRWDLKHELYSGEREWLGLITLPSFIQKEADSFDLHPSLLDFSTVFALAYSVEDLYLPYSYNKISIQKPLPFQLYSHVMQREIDSEFITLDVDLINPSGDLLVSIKGYKLKKIQSLSSSISEIDTSAQDISPQEGLEAFRRLFEQLLVPQVIVSPTSLIIDQSTTISTEEESPGLIEKHTRPNLFTKYEAPSNEVEKAVANIWESTLGIQKIGIDDNFIELGGNSLIGIQIVGKLNEMFPVEFSVEAFLENSTIRMISDYIIEKLLNQLDQDQLEMIISSDQAK